uniref:Zinc finger CCCH domain-containing protein 9 n=1 Tax=Lygus hesperus TaxID=30085 RepID=A0A0A9YKG1_LYGHE
MEVMKSDAAQSDSNEAIKHILAERFKTKLCKNFCATGECPYANHCMFAHGNTELRTCRDNIRDGLVTEEAIKAFHHQQAVQRRAMMRIGLTTQYSSDVYRLPASPPTHFGNFIYNDRVL